MKHAIAETWRLPHWTFFTAPLIIALCLLLCSFVAHRLADDFLKQLGIAKKDADDKITQSILGGGLDLYGVKNAKNIALGNRKAVVLDLLAYTRKQVTSPSFVKEYNAIRENHKPKDYVPQTPEQLKADYITRAKESVTQTEESLRKADASMKTTFQQLADAAKKTLKEAEDPNNRVYVNYTRNYEKLVEQAKESNAANAAQFEKRYPTNHLHYVKKRLQEFMDVTASIDYNAELKTKDGKKMFVNPAYERKDSRWKMAFRAGKEVVEPAREFVHQWIAEIN